MRSFVHRWLVTDWQLKLAGLAIALILYVYVRSEERVSFTLQVPLELRNPPRAMRFAAPPLRALEVRLEARLDRISSLEPGSVKAVVDLAGVQGLNASIRLTPNHIRRPPGVEVRSILPGVLVLTFKPVKNRRR